MNAVLVGYDDSVRSRDALVFGAALAESLDADLVAAVVDEFHLFGELPAAAERAAALRQVLENAHELLRGRRFEGRTIWGSVPECLDIVAQEVSADVIVVGSSHRGKAGQAVVGSVGDRLLAGAPCAVAIVPNGYAEDESASLERIGVGIDGEEESRSAAQIATEIAVAAGGSLRLIAVVPVFKELMPGRISGTLPGYRHLIEQRLAAELERAAAESPAELEVAETLIEGEPAEELRRQSGELDLLLLGSRGYGPLRRVFLGGVANDVVREVACPVLILPRSARRSRRERERELSTRVL